MLIFIYKIGLMNHYGVNYDAGIDYRIPPLQPVAQLDIEDIEVLLNYWSCQL